MRMDFEHYKEVLILVEPDITPQEIVGENKVIQTAENSSLAIQFLATEKCNVIVKYLVPLYLRAQAIEGEQLSIAEKLKSRQQYPKAIGDVNGKHAGIHKPHHGGSHYYNQKHINSIILMAIACSSYKSFYADLAENG